MILCYSAAPSHWSLYNKYSVNNISLSPTLRLWSSVTLLYTLWSFVMTLCSLTGMYQSHNTMSIHKNTAFFLVHGASTQSVINSTEYLNQIRSRRGFSESHTMLLNTIVQGQQNSTGLFENKGLGGTNMFLCSPICIHSLKAQWKAKQSVVSRVCNQCYFSNMLSSQTVHAVYGKAQWAHSQHLSWKYAWRIVCHSYSAILNTNMLTNKCTQ